MIYDCFTFFNELDLLEARFIELSGIVDKFVLIESSKTHQGKDKPLFFKINRERFKSYLDKIVYLQCEFPEPPPDCGNRIYNDVWRREAYQRRELRRGLSAAQPNDLIIVSDVDEILSADRLREIIKIRPRGSLTVFEQTQFEYYVNRRIEAWHNQGPRMIEYGKLSDPQLLRHSKAAVSKSIPTEFLTRLHARLWNYFNQKMGAPIYLAKGVGWHFSSLGGWHKWREKVDAFAHEEFKMRPEYYDEQAFKHTLYNDGTIVSGGDLPKFIKENPEKFGGLL
jgi:beta-1,4-mannosyl-glycoprotein beta-1,4-N-acetylglucosaminyltransferase